MPDVRNPGTAKQLAQEYCTNGRDKTKALIALGYSKKYATCGKGTLLFEDERVLEHIRAIDDKNRVKTNYNYDQAILELDQTIKYLKPKAKTGDVQASRALIAAIAEKNAITGLHKQEIKQTGDGLTINVASKPEQAPDQGDNSAGQIVKIA